MVIHQSSCPISGLDRIKTTKRTQDVKILSLQFPRRDRLVPNNAPHERELDSLVDIPEAVDDLSKLYSDNMKEFAAGFLPTRFTLTIARAGIDFSSEIVPFKEPEDQPSDEGSYTEDELAKTRGDSETLLKGWYEHADVSGYGDVRSQTNKVDPNVRNAKDIPAGDFTVSENLYSEIERIWAEQFLPGSVRVEPYKIHLYGPGGKFKEHRDTPEKDLVGTFLIGLGDSTTGTYGNLSVGRFWTGLKAYPGSWVAFYPDVAHEVKELEDGYRAVIAFKIFCEDAPASMGISQPSFQAKTALEQSLFDQMKESLSRLEAPYGILLQHKYCLDTTELSGLDSILYAAASSLVSDITSNDRIHKVHFLPVLINVDFRMEDYDSSEIERITAEVFPLTQTHIDALVADASKSFRSPEFVEEREYIFGNQRERLEARERRHDDGEETNTLDVDVSNTPFRWLTQSKPIPFYSLDLQGNKLTWNIDEQEGVELLGNCSRPESADSIYLSYAMIVMPYKKRVRDTQQ
ncbi:unnamed protein product [Somion occarium]|uniref:Prolyl 4-hydroxylase alpha subunit Fe(2+) 2OG dioxygenase domain-containing protein n=1 Tax=Somion occarium TaxID=3059160 RepID=A0ABP1E1K9_9APHY